MAIHELQIEGMSCSHCVKTVDEALRAVPGVTRVEVQIGHARVETSDAITKDALIYALAAADYPAN